MSERPLPARVGPYAIEGELGRGGMGVVYRARDPGGAPVAVKLLLNTGSDRAAGRFEREIAALTKLEHPGLVELRDAGAHGEHRYLVMELLEGSTLQQRLEAEGPLPSEEVARIGIALAEALAYVHRQGVIHRDLKPENVLFDAAGEPRLTDFGLVKELASDQTRLTRTGAFLGTPGFWAPEQAKGDVQGVGPWTDIYGLGAVLYAALTARPPHEGDTLMEIMAAVGRDPTPPSALVPEVDARLEGIVLRCMRAAPMARYRSALAVGSALEDWRLLGPEGSGRSPLVLGLALVVVLLLGGLGWALATRARPEVAATSPEPTATTSLAPIPTPTARPAPRVDPKAKLPVLLKRAELLTANRAWGEARAVLDEILAIDRNLTRALFLRGRLRRILGDGAGATLDFDRLLRIRPEDAEALIERAAARGSTGDAQGAIDDCTAALAIEERSYRAYYDRAGWRMRLRPPASEEALTDLDRAIALKATGEALCDRGMIRHRLERPGALEDFQAAVRKLPAGKKRRQAELMIQIIMDAEMRKN